MNEVVRKRYPYIRDKKFIVKEKKKKKTAHLSNYFVVVKNGDRFAAVVILFS